MKDWAVTKPLIKYPIISGSQESDTGNIKWRLLIFVKQICFKHHRDLNGFTKFYLF